jgi:hypothetical protein
VGDFQIRHHFKLVLKTSLDISDNFEAIGGRLHLNSSILSYTNLKQALETTAIALI